VRVPASVRLLQKLKETWGEDVTQDLVAWVGEAQAVNRAEIRELAEDYFARFSERLDQRASLWESRLEARLEAKLEERFNTVRLEIARLEGRLDTSIAGVEGRLDTSIASLRAEVAVHMRDQLKWMFVFWASTIVPLAGLIMALGKNWL
jgi:hypothetical protein